VKPKRDDGTPTAQKYQNNNNAWLPWKNPDAAAHAPARPRSTKLPFGSSSVRFCFMCIIFDTNREGVAQQHVLACDRLPAASTWRHDSEPRSENAPSRSLSQAAAAAWNSLPLDIRAEASPATFNKLLKTHFLT